VVIENKAEYLPPLDNQNWQCGFDSLLLDVDSCLSAIEGVDELANLKGKKPEIAQLTAMTMNGEVPFEAIFEQRLKIIQSCAEDLETIGRLYIQTVTPDAPETVTILRENGVRIILLSGGYDAAIYPLADFLGIPRNSVFANHLFFNKEGLYQGYDFNNPLCHNLGKLKIITSLKASNAVVGNTVIVGDGNSELETKPAVDLCVGFGGYVKREKVKNQADIFIPHNSFLPLIPLVLGKGRTTEFCTENFNQEIVRTGLNLLKTAAFQHRAVNLQTDIINFVI